MTGAASAFVYAAKTLVEFIMWQHFQGKRLIALFMCLKSEEMKTHQKQRGHLFVKGLHGRVEHFGRFSVHRGPREWKEGMILGTRLSASTRNTDGFNHLELLADYIIAPR